MNIQLKNSAHHFRMQSEREQTLVRGCLRNLYQSVAIHMKYVLIMYTKVFSLIIICNCL